MDRFQLALIYFLTLVQDLKLKGELHLLGLNERQANRLLNYNYRIRMTRDIKAGYALFAGHKIEREWPIYYSHRTQKLSFEENLQIVAHELRHLVSFPLIKTIRNVNTIVTVIAFLDLFRSPLVLIIWIGLYPFRFVYRRYASFLDEVKAYTLEYKIATTHNFNYRPSNVIDLEQQKVEALFKYKRWIKFYERFLRGYPSREKIALLELEQQIKNAPYLQKFDRTYLETIYSRTQRELNGGFKIEKF
jgi:hypothetical protein